MVTYDQYISLKICQGCLYSIFPNKDLDNDPIEALIRGLTTLYKREQKGSGPTNSDLLHPWVSMSRDSEASHPLRVDSIYILSIVLRCLAICHSVNHMIYSPFTSEHIKTSTPVVKLHKEQKSRVDLTTPHKHNRWHNKCPTPLQHSTATL